MKMVAASRIGKPGWLLTAILVTVLVGGGLATFCCARNRDQTVMDNILTSVMDYIKQNHLDVAPLIKENMSWTESSQTILDGYSRFAYTSNGWTVTIGYTITPDVIYDVRAECKSEGIVWVGKVKSGAITEKSYTKQ